MPVAVLAQDPSQVVSYADGEWNCADPACDERVNEGDSQPNYECAEFVSRCLAAGGYIPNLSQNDSQNAYYNYQYQGTNYDLLWVSSVQGQPLGLEDLLQVLGWKNIGNTEDLVDVATVLILEGADGPHSHTAIGIGSDDTDAHNIARYHVPASVYMGIDAIYAYPNKK